MLTRARSATAAGARRLRVAAAADGAGESGLAALLWTHALQASGDALVAVALAGTVFFNVPLGQARGRVGLYLFLTLLPFALLVPVAGPLLDRFRHGRRTVLAVACASRGVVSWLLAGALASLALYPLALAVLVLARAYGVARNAAVVRVRPPALGLVASNARMNVAATVASGAAAGLAVGISRVLGPSWDLRLAAVVFLAAAVFALRLPAQVDEARAVERVAVARYLLTTAPAVVRRPLVATTALRVLAGLLTIGLAFLLRSEKTPGPEVAVVLGAAVVGSLLGTGLASRVPARTAARLSAASLAAAVVACVVAAVFAGAVSAAAAVGVSGLTASLAKYGLDAALQEDAPPAASGGAFSRSETLLQLAWAVGGAVGLLLSLATVIGLGGSAAFRLCFAVAAGAPVAGLVVSLRWRAPVRAELPAPVTGVGSGAGRWWSG